MQLPILQKHGITHVICIRQNIEANFIKPNFQQLFRYLVLDIADNPVENIIRFFPTTKEFIDGSLQTGVQFRDVLTLCLETNLVALGKGEPKATFSYTPKLVQEYEAIYLAKLTIQMMSPLQLERSLSVPPGTTGSLKRTHEDEEEFGNMQVAAAQNG
ncbi:Serine/threonine/tyrosine-interacting protein [Chelonia mydas]|uniref:Serine/threonine/tyrosine-interacting protein n=1 Tax=Chelonia mydas TaxID=8469 RepID=M7BC08_CHEMY|nr:Serine/threonine/tyrosine-interacting protein [Chelonia mydas]